MQLITATAALMAGSATAQSVGNAIIENMCSYNVELTVVPAQNGGYETTQHSLSSGGSWSTQWKELSTGAGWSLKLSKDQDLDHILQYEYTFQDDGTIWYDLSQVNGNPWDGDWMITANSESSTCSPKQQAYRYATDDAYGMQACPQDSDITVTLCSGEDQNDGAVASASSVAAETSQDAATGASTYATPTSTPAESSAFTSSTPTTFATMTSAPATSSDNQGGDTVTNVATAVETAVVTQTHYWDHGYHHGRRGAHNHA
ncbi:hypothetical protein KC318_g197 [Hortaea werneckii]|uniref:Uncharacterized protein n=1 Tax=Hortaea werneckii TaxID=91943 RepID=A0A3M7ACH5_HORWE|nr:hypothetical protein KC334_g723 [Hortaea werneckii]KAI7027487.1 hypothetical protein KC355_g308 [Hortaea werneckii]KAI7676561.1 hypothetical protein KC318_g197 [Hortaea werneckii]RMY24980.1 hypothetical protein D0867_01023 [Hortaea werneckii]RMY40515.1 hypothetical protein D0866_01209 [Hortaea werneckii]